MAGFGWRTARAAHHLRSEVDPFSDAQSIFKLDAQVAHSAVHLGMAKQQLDGSKIAGFAVNLRCFRPAQRVSSVSARLKPDQSDSVADQPSVLAVWPAAGFADADGLGVFSYEWARRDGIWVEIDGEHYFSGWDEIDGATEATYALTQEDVGFQIRLQVSYVDGLGFEEIAFGGYSAVENVNDAPSGSVAISGTARQGETPTADATGVSDVDGIDATTVAYQWLRSGTAISGATASMYELTQDDVGATISVRFSFVDGQGNAEGITSTAEGEIEPGQRY